MAKELSSGKYDQRIIPNKKKEQEKQVSHDFDVITGNYCDGGPQCTYPYCECVMY